MLGLGFGLIRLLLGLSAHVVVVQRFGFRGLSFGFGSLNPKFKP